MPFRVSEIDSPPVVNHRESLAKAFLNAETREAVSWVVLLLCVLYLLKLWCWGISEPRRYSRIRAPRSVSQ